MTDGNLGAYAEAVALKLLGEPNREKSTKYQLRFGTHGSMAVEIGGNKAGTWYDFED
jgi:putative DNA primase/helicase